MKKEIQYFSIRPKIILADTTATVTVTDRCAQSFLKDGEEYEIHVYHMEHLPNYGNYDGDIQTVRAVGGTLKFQQFFPCEQEHTVEIRRAGADEEPFARLRVYSVENDLFARNPYKGDLHMHSHCSDGAESPAFVAASCRKIGYDFMALTDHRVYKPSIAAQNAFETVRHDLLICRGEEVHPPENPVHIINFGGSFSVNELMSSDPEGYNKAVAEISKTVPVVDDEIREHIASSIWAFNKIREGGGLSIFCHPYWLIPYGYYISETQISYLLEKQPFDAYELIGGFERCDAESNNLSVARYQEARAAGRKIPVVGVSDSHGCESGELFGWYYTIVFSASQQQNDLIQGIKELHSVAVEAVPGESVRVYGPFRLVKYALFLIREVFPEHDELCAEEGALMRAYIGGSLEAAERLNAMSGRTQELIQQMKSE